MDIFKRVAPLTKKEVTFCNTSEEIKSDIKNTRSN
jgi:hypothetical protein